MSHDWSTFHGHIRALEEATAEWRPRARKTAKNLLVDANYLRADDMETHDILMAIYEGVYNYVQTKGKEPLPSELENVFYELGSQPRWEVARSLFRDTEDARFYRRYEKIWQQYTVLTDRFANQLDFNLGAPQLVAIWHYLGVKVSIRAERLMRSLVGSGSHIYHDLNKLAKEASLQVVRECERAVSQGEERTTLVPLNMELGERLTELGNPIVKSLEKDFPGLSAGVLYSMGYTYLDAQPSIADQREALNEKVLSQTLYDYGKRLVEMSKQVEELSTQLHLMEIIAPGVMEFSVFEESLKELREGKPLQRSWTISHKLA